MGRPRKVLSEQAQKDIVATQAVIDDKTKDVQSLRGMRDTLPQDQKYWQFIYSKLIPIVEAYGFSRIDTPILESTSLFKRTIGTDTDIVSKELFSFIDKNGDDICLRPEGTAAVAKAYIEHGMFSEVQPVKLYYIGPMYRHEKPQDQRFRQFHQFGFEIIGDRSPILDVELILLVTELYKELGIGTPNVEINNVGCKKCRTEYKQALLSYYKSRRYKICSNCNDRLSRNPFRVLDCKEDRCIEAKEGAPNFVDYLCDECQGYFIKTLEHLDALKISYNLNNYLVRGLDYYTKTTFEIWSSNDKGGKHALGGGGRYDYLIEDLCGRDVPACGYAGGIERLIAAMKENNVVVPEKKKADVFLAHLGEQAKIKSLILFEELRKEGVTVAHNLSKNQLRSQLEIANKSGTRLVLILGQKEVLDGTIIIRDMDSGGQEVINFDKIPTEIKKRLEKLNQTHKEVNL